MDKEKIMDNSSKLLPEPIIKIEGKIIQPDGTEIPFIIDTEEKDEN